MESVLVIVLAETREHELTFESFRKNLLDVFSADLALCVGANEREDRSNPYYRNARYVWSYVDPNDWGDAFDEAQRKLGGQGSWRRLLEIQSDWLGGVLGEGQQPGSGAIQIFFRWFLGESLREAGVLDRYDRFVMVRSDFMHRIPHVPLSLLDPRWIWVPDGEDYQGITDRMTIMSRADVLDVLGVAEPLLLEPDALYERMAARGENDWNPEKYLRFCFEHSGVWSRIRRYPYTMYAVRSPGGHTRWSEGRFREDLGYYVKYPGEYRSYRAASRVIRDVSDWTPFTVSLVNWMVSLARFHGSLPKGLRRFLRAFRSRGR